MGLSYDPTKPAANDKPSNDQAPMQTNFASIKTLIDVDHVDFENSQYGQHNQVTFATNNVPTPPVTPPKLFTNTVSGLPQLFFYSGDTGASSSQYTLGTNGSTFLLGGIIVKWGLLGTVSGSLVDSFTFTGLGLTDFPNALFNVQLTIGSTTVGPDTTTLTVQANAFSTSGFSVTKSSKTKITNTWFFAIGN